jgi:hypothetical protein
LQHARRFAATAGTALVLGAGAVLAPRAAPAPSTAETVVREYVAAQNAHQLDKLGTLAADSLQVGYLFGATGGPGKMAVESRAQHLALVSSAITRFPKIRFEIVSLVTEKNIVVTKENLTGGGPTGSQLGMSIYRVNGGRIDYIAIAATK